MAMETRRKELYRRMAEAGIDAAILAHPRDILYYAGTVRPSTLLVGPEETVLFVRRGLERARQEVAGIRIESGGRLRHVAAALRSQAPTGGRLGLEIDVLPARLYLRVREALPEWTVVDLSPLILEQRMTKDEREVTLTQRAAAAADAGHEAMAHLLRPGMTELELAAAVEASMRRAGHEGYQPLRYPGARGGGVLLMSGENLTVRGGHGLVVTGIGLSPASPYGASRRRIRAGDLVVLDTGTTCGGYTADESRTYVAGRARPDQHALFEVALAAEEAILDALRPGTPVAGVYAAAEEVVARGNPPHFPPGSLALPGFVGHGIGLELDEPPVIWDREERPILTGMVLAVEVEVSAPDAGMMAKVEDTVVVERDGPRLLTHAPRSLIEVRA